jgi:protein TonB
MEIKKNSKADLEKYKLLFFGISLLISILILIFAFRFETSTKINDFGNQRDIEEGEQIEITRQDIPELPVEQVQEQHEQIDEIIELVSDNTEIDDSNLDFPEFDEGQELNLNETFEDDQGDQIYVYVKNMPEFPGGDLALRKWIAQHINYPHEAKENGIEGTVYLRFEVTKTGAVGKVEIDKGADPLLDKEALSVIKELPNFKPGEQNGKKVNVWYTIPVTFRLN